MRRRAAIRRSHSTARSIPPAIAGPLTIGNRGQRELEHGAVVAVARRPQRRSRTPRPSRPGRTPQVEAGAEHVAAAGDHHARHDCCRSASSSSASLIASRSSIDERVLALGPIERERRDRARAFDSISTSPTAHHISSRSRSSSSTGTSPPKPRRPAGLLRGTRNVGNLVAPRHRRRAAGPEGRGSRRARPAPARRHRTPPHRSLRSTPSAPRHCAIRRGLTMQEPHHRRQRDARRDAVGHVPARADLVAERVRQVHLHVDDTGHRHPARELAVEPSVEVVGLRHASRGSAAARRRSASSRERVGERMRRADPTSSRTRGRRSSSRTRATARSASRA